MKTSYRIKGSIFATFFVCCIIIVLLSSSLATDHWISASARRNISNPTSGSIVFGLFNGKKILNSGLGDRTTIFKLADVPQSEPEFMSYGLWLSTIVMLGAAIAFTLVAAMFAILNTATTPVETIFGVIGLYVWNAIAMVFELLALSLWGAQFHQHLQHSVLWRDELTQQWTTDGMANLGYSYWLVFVAMFLHAVNMGVLWFGTHQRKPKTVQVPVDRGANNTNIIY